ncbi:MAG: SAM-dependent methyltransferase [Elusimicrobiota bacterium]
MKFPRNWPRRFFKPEIFSPGSPEAASRAKTEAAFAAKALNLKTGSRLLDICCGAGRHSLALARRGILVTGVDATPSYLRQARRLAENPDNPAFAQCDMRRLPYRGRFDAAINLWTSFGYFENPGDDLLALRRAARALKPGGLFLIDVVNGAWIARRGLSKNWFHRSDGSVVLEETILRQGRDPAHINEWTVLRPGKKPARASFFVRLYDAARLGALLRRAGMTPLRRWGDFSGRPYSRACARLIILARTKSPAPAQAHFL